MTDSYKFVKIETLVPAERALFDPSLGGALAALVFGAISGLRRMFEQARGVPNRFGIFLLADALLVRTARRTVTRIPRAAVKSASFSDEKRQDGTTFRHADVNYTTADGLPGWVRIDSELASDDARPAVVATVHAWSQACG